MAIEKTLVTGVGVVLAGLVGYKIIKKKNPKWVKKVKHALSNTTGGASKLLEGSKEAFQEGYASA